MFERYQILKHDDGRFSVHELSGRFTIRLVPELGAYFDNEKKAKVLKERLDKRYLMDDY